MFSGRIDRNLVIDGVINGKSFRITGQGGADDGLSGIQEMKATHVGGNPLPFSWHAITPLFTYGCRAFTRYPSHIHDYFKSSFPEGMQFKRTMEFQDGGLIEASANFTSMDEDSHTIMSDISLKGQGFDPNGPVMTKKLLAPLPTDQAVIPKKNGVSTYVHMMWPTTTGDITVANVVTHYTSNRIRNPLPKPHYIYHTVEIVECIDNFIHQKEISSAHEIVMI